MNRPNEPEGSKFFDRWAETYDQSVPASVEFPFAGYDQVLAGVVSQAEVRSIMSVLDLGTGTGNLAGHFCDSGCTVWATDFSPGMIAQAKAKCPGAELAVADLQSSPPDTFPSRYDRIVSAYAFHHLGLSAKVGLIQKLASNHLLPGGRLVIADVSFSTVEDRLAARTRFGELWDSSEHYWAGDETKALLGGVGLGVEYTQVSSCAGVFVIE